MVAMPPQKAPYATQKHSAFARALNSRSDALSVNTCVSMSPRTLRQRKYGFRLLIITFVYIHNSCMSSYVLSKIYKPIYLGLRFIYFNVCVKEMESEKLKNIAIIKRR